MSAALLRPQPLPLERLRPGVGLLVFAIHLGLLWLATLYWPMQSVLFGAVQTTAQSITVQILQKTTDRATSADNNAALSANPQAISNPGRQRFGRAEAMLDLPAAQLDASTPLAGTVQLAQAAPPVPSRLMTVAVPPPVVTDAPAPSEPQARPVPQAAAAPEPVPTSVVRTIDEKLPAPVPAPVPVPVPVQPLAVITTPPPSPQPSASPPPVTAAAPSAAPAAPAPTLVPAPVAAAPAVSPSQATASSVAAPSNPGSTTASGATLASGNGTTALGTGSAAVPVLSLPGTPAAGTPLNLNLPPRYIYRPPIAVPRRSLSEMANEQLRRKPRDAFAEGIESAGNIDCLKEAPEGPAQGLLAIGPLLKRAIEEKCRK